MGFLCNHQELIHCHYIIFYWKFYWVFYICIYLFLGGEKTLEVGWKALVETLFEQNGWKWKGEIYRYIYCIALQSSLVRITSSISKWCLIITCLPLYVNHNGVNRPLKCIIWFTPTDYVCAKHFPHFWYFFDKRKNCEVKIVKFLLKPKVYWNLNST